jgi:rhodanese-related sulfurtransferase
MKKFYTIVACVAILGLSGIASAATAQDTETIRATADKMLSEVSEKGYHMTADEVMARIQSGKQDFVLVDCREKEEKFKAGHIPGAIYINFKDIAKTENLAKLPMDKDVILYCNTGHEENKALGALRMMGYNAYALKFGYAAWKKEKPSEAMAAALANADAKNYPVEK